LFIEYTSIKNYYQYFGNYGTQPKLSSSQDQTGMSANADELCDAASRKIDKSCRTPSVIVRQQAIFKAHCYNLSVIGTYVHAEAQIPLS